MKGEGKTKSLLVTGRAGAAVWMDTGLCVILRAADLFHCECFPLRIGQTQRKVRKRSGDESQSRWAVLHGGNKKIDPDNCYLFIYLSILA